MIYKIKLNILLLIKIFQTFIFSASKKSLKDEKTMKVERLIISYTKSFIKERKKIVFLHGWGQSKDTWDKQIKKLKKNYSVYSLDLPGFGKSDCPSHALNISDYVNILNRFYIKLKISKSILIGHSFGGKVAAEFAVRYPQKIEKLVLYSTDLTKKKSLFKKYLLILVNILSSRKMSFLIKLFLKKSKISYKNFLVLCKTYTDARLESKTSEKISRFNKPILYIYGKYDFLFPLSKVKLNLKKLSQVRVVEFEKSSHLAHLEEEKKFTKKLLEFIKLNK